MSAFREFYLRWNVRRAGLAALRADRAAERADTRLRAAVAAYGAIKVPQGAQLKALWPIHYFNK